MLSRSVVSNTATLWTVACQASLSMGFPRQEYWSGLPFPSPGDLPDPGIERRSPMSPALQVDPLPTEQKTWQYANSVSLLGRATVYCHVIDVIDSGCGPVVKNLLCNCRRHETWVWSLGHQDPLEEDMATHFSILAWKIPWTEEIGGLNSMGSQRVGHDWATDHTSTPISYTVDPLDWLY